MMEEVVEEHLRNQKNRTRIKKSLNSYFRTKKEKEITWKKMTEFEHLCKWYGNKMLVETNSEWTNIERQIHKKKKQWSPTKISTTYNEQSRAGK